MWLGQEGGRVWREMEENIRSGLGFTRETRPGGAPNPQTELSRHRHMHLFKRK